MSGLLLSTLDAVLLAALPPLMGCNPMRSPPTSLSSTATADTRIPVGEPMALPEPGFPGTTTLEQALQQRRSVREYAKQPLTLDQVAQLAWAAQGDNDPRGNGRTAPSAGATYPIELYVVARDVEGLNPGVYRYVSSSHQLEAVAAKDAHEGLASASADWVAQAPAVLVIAGVVERTATRYGNRAQRYVDLEAGAVMQNVALAAVALGLGTVVVGAFDDQDVANAVGLEAGERPLVLMPVGLPGGP